jgi:hypothetical protein
VELKVNLNPNASVLNLPSFRFRRSVSDVAHKKSHLPLRTLNLNDIELTLPGSRALHCKIGAPSARAFRVCPSARGPSRVRRAAAACSKLTAELEDSRQVRVRSLCDNSANQRAPQITHIGIN